MVLVSSLLLRLRDGICWGRGGRMGESDLGSLSGDAAEGDEGIHSL